MGFRLYGYGLDFSLLSCDLAFDSGSLCSRNSALRWHWLPAIVYWAREKENLHTKRTRAYDSCTSVYVCVCVCLGNCLLQLMFHCESSAVSFHIMSTIESKIEQEEETRSLYVVHFGYMGTLTRATFMKGCSVRLGQSHLTTDTVHTVLNVACVEDQ